MHFMLGRKVSSGFFIIPFAGGAGRILLGTFGLLRSDREQALRSEVPCASVFGSSGEVLGELPGGLLLVPEGLLSSAVKNHATQKITKVVLYMINKINRGQKQGTYTIKTTDKGHADKI